MNQRKFRDICGSFATGVTVVTTKGKNDKPIGMTANSFTSLSLEPPLVLFNIDKKASLYNDFMTNNCFAVNILSSDQQELSRKFSKRGVDRFQGVSYTEDITGAPILIDTLGYFDCLIKERVDSGDHIIVIGEVQNGELGDGKPLVFYQGKYTQIVNNLN